MSDLLSSFKLIRFNNILEQTSIRERLNGEKKNNNKDNDISLKKTTKND